jgi:hypothetical protein
MPPADAAPPTHVSLPTNDEQTFPVADALPARYDEFDAQPLLSDQEMRALLGTTD